MKPLSHPARIVGTIASILVLGAPLYRFFLPSAALGCVVAVGPALVGAFVLALGAIYLRSRIVPAYPHAAAGELIRLSKVFGAVGGGLLLVGITGLFFRNEIIPPSYGSNAAATLDRLSVAMSSFGVAMLSYSLFIFYKMILSKRDN